MDWDETESPAKAPSFAALSSDILGAMGIGELENYIAELESEIARARAAIATKRFVREGAEALFKR
jgi:uncharacterized small protein (DUF1192 family)